MKAAGPLLDNPRLFHEVVSRMYPCGYAEADVEWSLSRRSPVDPDEFAREVIFVICNSGMHNAVARQIFDRCMTAISCGNPVSEVFGHKGKADAIERIWVDREGLMLGFLDAQDKVAYCRSIPWIGDITSHHLAKSFGVQVAKPDIHLQRLADRHGTTVQDLCESLSGATGFPICAIDVILWRACAEGILDARTGTFRVKEPPMRQRPHQQHELFQPVQQDLFG